MADGSALEPPAERRGLSAPALNTALQTRLARAEELLGHHFAAADLLAEALTHRSAMGGRRPGRGRKSARATGPRAPTNAWNLWVTACSAW